MRQAGVGKTAVDDEPRRLHSRLGTGGGSRNRESRPPGPGDRRGRGGAPVPGLLPDRVDRRPRWRQAASSSSPSTSCTTLRGSSATAASASSLEPKDAAVVTEALGVEPFVACTSDFGWISRPRLWWMSPAVTTMSIDPAEGRQLQWGKHGVAEGTVGGHGSGRPLLPRGRDVGPATTAVRHHAGRG